MNPTLARQMVRLALLGAALFLGACVTSNDTTELIDPAFKDAKVDARTGGQSLAGSFDQGKDWSNTMTAPTGLQPLGAFSATAQVGAVKKVAALAKQSDINIGDSLMANLDDTAKGYATIYKEVATPFTTTDDTAIVRWDAQARDTIKNNENIISWKRVVTYHPSKKVETTTFTDGDGNGIVTAVPGHENDVVIKFTSSDAGTVEVTTVKVGAGPDNNFDTEDDNIVLSAEWTKTKDGVVTGEGAYLDGDGDGVVVDNSKDCIVLAKYSELNPKDKPHVAKASFEAKVREFAHKAGDEPVTFAYEEDMENGRVNSISIHNRAGGTEIVKNDTMTLHLETTVADAKDTLKHAVVEFVYNPGQDLKSDSDDVCYAIHITTEKKLGLERSAEFNFVSDTPIPHGKDPVAGSFDGHATYANGKSASLKGTFSPTGFSAEFTGPEGNTVKVEYTKSGDVAVAGAI